MPPSFLCCQRRSFWAQGSSSALCPLGGLGLVPDPSLDCLAELVPPGALGGCAGGGLSRFLPKQILGKGLVWRAWHCKHSFLAGYWHGPSWSVFPVCQPGGRLHSPQGVLLSSALAGSLLPSHGGRGQGVKPAICPDEAPREGQPHFGWPSGIGALMGGGHSCLHSSSARQSQAILT